MGIMRPFTHPSSRYLLLGALLVALGGLVFVAVSLGFQRPDSGRIEVALVITPVTPDWTPAAPLAPVDPAIIAYLEFSQPSYGVIPLQVLGPNVPPVGAYLPLSGNIVAELPSRTPSITPTFTPSSTPLPTDVPSLTPSFTPSPTLPPPVLPTSNSELVGTALAIAATVTLVRPGPNDCAPGGLPISGMLTQRFHANHPGIDIAADMNTTVLATQSGKVIYAGWSSIGYGNLVVIQSGVFSTYYAHNTSVLVKEGDTVKRSQSLALSGSTGNSSGPHVHYETRLNDIAVDPLTFEWRGFRVC